MKSVKARLTYNYLVIIVLTVLTLEVLIGIAVKRYYYDNAREILSKQAVVSSNFYNEYISSGNLQEDIEKLLRSFSFNISVQIQILDSKGQVIGDSLGIPSYKVINDPDVLDALSFESSFYTGRIKETNEPIMSASSPLVYEGKVIGAIRFISSLRNINKIISRTIIILIFIGFIIIIIALVISLLLSNTITRPVKSITSAAREMSSGHFNVKAEKKYDDEIGELADTLNFMAGEILNHEKLKNEFISSISHELRTPLTSIKGWAITLRSGDLNNHDEILEGLEIIENESDRLTSLVTELLDFSKFEAGRITIKREIVDTKKLLETTFRQMKPRADRLGIIFNLFYEEDMPNIDGDYNRLRQVLINIIDNAFKFTTEGGQVEICGKCDEKNIMISIEDNGSGIDEEDIPKITEKFYKGKNSLTGNGLGLSICSEIIKLHQGLLEVESLKDVGTTFKIILTR